MGEMFLILRFSDSPVSRFMILDKEGLYGNDR
jgi:hypothetical protein